MEISGKGHFIEEFGILFEAGGVSRTAGKILGAMLISDAEYLSLDELAQELEISKASVSTNTRLLIQLGLIDRRSPSGERRDYFSLRRRMWRNYAEQQMEKYQSMRLLAEEGLHVVGEGEKRARKNLRRMHLVYSFLEREAPECLDRMERETDQADKG